MYCLDTDIIVALVRGDASVKKKIAAVSAEEISFTMVTLCELFRGAYASAETLRNVAWVRTFAQNYRPLLLDARAAEIFGIDFNNLEKKGQQTQLFDLLIASIAKAHQLTLVTRNQKHFANMPDLAVEEW